MNRSMVIASVVVLLGAHFILGMTAINRLSPTYDEPLHLAAGYSYLRTGNYYLNIYDHPPLAEMIAALPLLSMKPVLLTSHPSWGEYRQYSFANLFLYHNRVDAEKMLNSGRMMILLFSCLLGFAVYYWGKQMYGTPAGIAGLILYCFCSTFIAHGSLVTTDLVFVLFYFLSMYALWRWTGEQNMKNAVIMGVFFGLALVSKFSSVIVPCMYGLVLLYFRYMKKVRLFSSKVLLQVLVFSAVVLAVILIVYRFNSPGLYTEGLRRTLARMDKGRSAFLLGDYSTSGWKHYFLVTFLTKSSIPFIITLVLSLLPLRKNWYESEKVLFLLVPAAVYFLLSSFSRVQIGHRHLMPVYPFLMVWSGSLAVKAGEGVKGRVISAVLAVLFFGHAASAARANPWHLSYFNEFTRGSGQEYLTDSNIDWGQGLKELGRWCGENGVEGLYMSYFGTGDPHYYGIKYVPVGFIDNLEQGERRGDIIGEREPVYFAVSVTNLKATYYAEKNVFAWLEEYEPVAVAADSIYVYDLTGKAGAIEELKKYL